MNIMVKWLLIAGVFAFLAALAVVRGILAVVLVFGAALGVIMVVSALAGIASIVFAVLPVAKVPLSYNFRNLQIRWKTSLVTGVAFIVVIGLLVVMLAFVRGMYDATQGTGHPGNVIALADGSTDETFSNLPGNVSVAELPSELQKQVVKDGGEFLAVKEVYVVVSQKLPQPKPNGQRHRFVQMRGIDNARLAAKVHQIELQPGGKWFSSSGVREIPSPLPSPPGGEGKVRGTAYEIVVGEGVARDLGSDLGKPTVQVGDIVQIGPAKWYVSGIMKSAGSSFGSEIWAKDTLIGETFGRRNSYSSFMVRTADADSARKAADLLKQARASYSLSAMPETEYYAKLGETTQQYLWAIVFVALWMGVGGTLGVMTTMFAAISNRAKDIGVLRLLGFKRTQILMSFLFESLLIAFIGGLLGCLIGSLVNGLSATSVVGGATGGGKSIALELTVDSPILLTAMGFALIMGAVGGLIPALSAMRLKPLESLR